VPDVKLADVERLLETTRSCGVSVSLTTNGSPSGLDPDVEHAAYRVVQECLSNVIKHGGPHPTATVDFEWTPTSFNISVWNDQRADIAPNMVSGGFGLQGLEERLAVLGGELRLGPVDEGYLVQAVLPLPGSMANQSRSRSQVADIP
jgi:signal transduction histidine kinase